MTTSSALAAAPLCTPSFPTSASDRAAALLAAARALLPKLEAGRPIDAPVLRAAMVDAFDATDAEGAWGWKDAYEACEAALVLFVQRYGAALGARPSATQLAMLTKVAGLFPSQTRRSEESQAFQQFSTPVTLGLAAARAAMIGASDLVLEPSAGTGLLAALAQGSGAGLALNELADLRAEILVRLFPAATVTRFDAAQINDHLDPSLRPTVVLMNPPFSVAAKVEGRVADAAMRHVGSALARLADRGRLVTITGAGLSPDNTSWRDAFVRLQARGRVLFTAAVAGQVYARHGTTTQTRLTVIDRMPADDPTVFPPSAGLAPDAATLLAWVERDVPTRTASTPARSSASTAPRRSASPYRPTSRSVARPLAPVAADAVELAYEPVEAEATEAARLSEALYEPFALQTVRIAGARPHPTPLVQSAAMASVRPPSPTYRPHVPVGLVEAGLLSDAQLETLILAGEAHGSQLAGAWTVDDTNDVVAAAPDDAEAAVRFRRGFMLGDGTGAGKGRQVAAVILDNWLKGRRRALWVSKSDTLIEDAQRDWSALGQERLLIQPLSRFRQGTPVQLDEGVLFATYATLRSDARGERVSRVAQIVEWLGSDFDGVIVFDESHAMQNAAGSKGSRGDTGPSQQGKAGLRLQHALANARVLYVSATGATDRLRTLPMLPAPRPLGRRTTSRSPRAPEFVAAMEKGGVAAMEVISRDLQARSASTPRDPCQLPGRRVRDRRASAHPGADALL